MFWELVNANIKLTVFSIQKHLKTKKPQHLPRLFRFSGKFHP